MRTTKLNYTRQDIKKWDSLPGTKLIFFSFLLFNLISPWFWVLGKNFKSLNSTELTPILTENEVFKNEINSLRGEMKDSGFPALLSRILVNKISFYAIEITHRYLETFDPQYLFFIGDTDSKKSTHAAGPLYLTFLPLIILGLYWAIKNKQRTLFVIFLLSPIPASFSSVHYETILRIPVFIILSLFASMGLVKLFSVKKVLALLIITFLLFEFLKFSHDFVNHYPERVVQTST